jgi:phosphopantetheine--protein transferase-like protein
VPIFFQQQINGTTRLGIWKIEETEEFFLSNVPLQQEVTHPHKRLQHLAGRFLLQFLFPDFPYELIRIADTRKPYLPGEQYHFSISHCGDFAAAIVSSDKRVGIDIEMITSRIHRIAKKFLSEYERKYLDRDDQLFLQKWGLKERVETEFLTFIWSAKEAVFKWYGNGQVDFSEHISLRGDILFNEDDTLNLPFVFAKNTEVQLTIHGRLIENLALAWVMSH